MLLNYHFKVSFNLKLFLYVAKMTQNTIAFHYELHNTRT